MLEVITRFTKIKHCTVVICSNLNPKGMIDPTLRHLLGLRYWQLLCQHEQQRNHAMAFDFHGLANHWHTITDGIWCQIYWYCWYLSDALSSIFIHILIDATWHLSASASTAEVQGWPAVGLAWGKCGQNLQRGKWCLKHCYIADIASCR